MPKNLSRYYLAWEFRQQGKTFKEIGKIMKISSSRVNILVHYINFKIKYQKQRKISKELKDLVNKFNFKSP